MKKPLLNMVFLLSTPPLETIQSPYVSMGQNYMNQTNRLWFEIFQIVKENCTGDYKGANPQDDVMERLLSARRANKTDGR